MQKHLLINHGEHGGHRELNAKTTGITGQIYLIPVHPVFPEIKFSGFES